MAKGNNGGSDAPEASGGNQEINSGQTDNANSVTDTPDKPASSLGFLAETSDSLGLACAYCSDSLLRFCYRTGFFAALCRSQKIQ